MSRTLFKAKKFVASKFSELQAGRSLLLKLFGPNGDHIVNAMKESAEKYDNIEKAKQLKLDLLKLTVKVVLLHNHRVITDEMAKPARQPLLLMLEILISSLETVKARRNPKELSDAMHAVHTHGVSLLQPHVRDHNWKRLTRIFDFYGDVGFLTAFLKDESYEPQRQAILDSFRTLLQPFDVEMTELKELMLRKDVEKKKYYEKLVREPVLKDWLAEEHVSALFSEWLQQNIGSDGSNYRKFLKSVNYFKTTNNRSLLEMRADQVYNQYIADSAPDRIQLDEGVLMDVKTKYLESGRTTPRTLFKVAEDKAFERLDELFSTGFVGSEQFNVVVAKLAETDERLEIHSGVEERIASQKNNADERQSTLSDVTNDPDSHLGNMSLSAKDVPLEAGEHEYDSENDTEHEHDSLPAGAAEE